MEGEAAGNGFRSEGPSVTIVCGRVCGCGLMGSRAVARRSGHGHAVGAGLGMVAGTHWSVWPVRVVTRASAARVWRVLHTEKAMRRVRLRTRVLALVQPVAAQVDTTYSVPASSLPSRAAAALAI